MERSEIRDREPRAWPRISLPLNPGYTRSTRLPKKSARVAVDLLAAGA
jgi:hypothetical protein